MRSSTPPSFLIVEDHPLTRSGTRGLLEHAFPGCLCQEASTLADAHHQIEKKRWSLVLLDLRLPDGAGLALLPSCSCPVLVLTMQDEQTAREKVLVAGATGFATKGDSPGRIIQAIQSILTSHQSVSSVPPGADWNLSTREDETLRHLLAGRHQTEIAQIMGVSTTTVQSYKNRLFVKLRVDSIAELVKVASGLTP